MSFQPIAVVLSICVAGAFAQSGGLDYNTSDTVSRPAPRALASKPGESAVAQQMYQSGSTIVTAGHVLAVGGTIMSTIGNFTGTPALSLIGNISNTIGVPLLGIGAGKVNTAAELLDPSYKANYRGWGWYWSGFVMGGIATIIVLNAASEINSATSKEEQDEAVAKLVPAIPLLIGSAVCNITSWVKFARLAGEGHRAMSFQSSLELHPQLFLAKDGDLTPGMGLTYRF